MKHCISSSLQGEAIEIVVKSLWQTLGDIQDVNLPPGAIYIGRYFCEVLERLACVLEVLVLLVFLVRIYSATQKLATKECNYKYCSHNLVSIVILHHHRCYQNGEVNYSSNMYSTLVNIIG